MSGNDKSPVTSERMTTFGQSGLATTYCTPCPVDGLRTTLTRGTAMLKTRERNDDAV